MSQLHFSFFFLLNLRNVEFGFIPNYKSHVDNSQRKEKIIIELLRLLLILDSFHNYNLFNILFLYIAERRGEQDKKNRIYIYLHIHFISVILY